MTDPIANTASGSTIAPTSNKCRAHSARPYSPPGRGVNTSRTKRFILPAPLTRIVSATSSYGEAAANSILPCAKVSARGFCSGQQDARLCGRTINPEDFDAPDPTQATGARLAVRGQAAASGAWL